MFKRWSENNPDAKEYLSPTFEMRDFDEISDGERQKIWQYLKDWFESEENEINVLITAIRLNELHKASSFAQSTLKDKTIFNAKMDLNNIFHTQEGDVVLEMLSIYAEFLISQRENETGPIFSHNYKEEADYKKAVKKWRWDQFDKFSGRLNEVFEQFGLNVFLSRRGLLSRQDKKITDQIYVPVMESLSAREWLDVNRELSDSLREYQHNTKYGYSNSVTHSISAVQAFLQIIVDGKTGGSEGIAALIKKGQEAGLLPDDKFTKTIFKNINDILMRERGLSGNAHPKTEYANEKNARLVLNLVMVFIQHCLQK